MVVDVVRGTPSLTSFAKRTVGDPVRAAPSLILPAVCAWAAAGAAAIALAQPASPVSRGELLYSTHCIACHTKEVHWRQQRLATDWPSLERQVRRWAANAGLAWSNEDVAEVARYLNAVHYHFAAPSVTGATPARNPG
jgi:mono/diheme cytochrome c family protein